MVIPGTAPVTSDYEEASGRTPGTAQGSAMPCDGLRPSFGALRRVAGVLAALQVTGARCGPRSSGSASRPRSVHLASCTGRNLADRQRTRRKAPNRAGATWLWRRAARNAPPSACLNETSKQAAAIIDREPTEKQVPGTLHDGARRCERPGHVPITGVNPCREEGTGPGACVSGSVPVS